MRINPLRNALLFIGAIFIALFAVLSTPGCVEALSSDGNLQDITLRMMAVFRSIVLTVGLLSIISGLLLHIYKEKIKSEIYGISERFNNYTDNMIESRAALALFFASFLGLFFEILIIRWLTTEVRLFAYMKNFSLISCFLGLGIGYSLSRGKAAYFPFFPIVFSLFCSFLLICSYSGLTYFIPFPERNEIMWGANWLAFYTLSYAGFYMALFGFFILNMVCFIPLGQLAGRLMLRFSPIPAYTINILGSLLGALAFSALSYLNSPPPYWFMIGCVPVFVFLFRQKPYLYAAVASSAFLMILLYALGRGVYWSPYYKITVLDYFIENSAGEKIKAGITLNVNEFYHQKALDLSDDFVRGNMERFPLLKEQKRSYDLPYRFIKAEKVLVVGAGMGNDVAAAIRNGASSVHAVEIDPVIVKLGIKNHREKPYLDRRVKLTINDARTFFESSEEKFDLIVFGLLDSQTLLSNFSNLRLDNYIYTLESFENAKKLLRPGGLIALSYATGGQEYWIYKRLYLMLGKVFGNEPLSLYTEYDGGYLFVCGENFNKNEKEKILKDEGFFLLKAPREKDIILPTDNWPFLYLNKPKISTVYWGALALTLILAVSVTRSGFQNFSRFNFHFFFLGAAFLLIEFRSITEMALLFGSTWIVNSIVISAVLIMILIANLLSHALKRFNFRLLYLLLMVSILVGYFVPLRALAMENIIARAALASIVLTLPVMLAGIIFACSIKNIDTVEDALGSNLIGAVFGGLCEYASIVYGLKSIYLIAILFYILSFAVFETKKQYPRRFCRRSFSPPGGAP